MLRIAIRKVAGRSGRFFGALRSRAARSRRRRRFYEVTAPNGFFKPRYTPMSRRRRIYEGKAKVLYEGTEPGT